MKKIVFTSILFFLCSVCVFGQANKKRSTVWEQKQESKTTTSKTCIPKNAFGMDLGIGSNGLSSLPISTFGIRYLHHFLPYFGVDFFKVNTIIGFVDYYENFSEYRNLYCNVQLMIGVRGNTPVFFKCMSGYGAFRMGYGADMDFNFYSRGLCLETEVGLNLARCFFLGYSYNWQRLEGFPVNYHALRIGFNFGK